MQAGKIITFFAGSGTKKSFFTVSAKYELALFLQ
jgi:hypothetical protein